VNKMNRFAKLAWVTLAWNVFDILWGAFVRATGSGAGCGNHWPTCNGAILPTPENIESVIEYTHRILSGVALILVLVLLIWGWRKYPRGHSIRIGVVGSMVFILLEAALGAGLVLLNSVMGNDSGLQAGFVAIHLLNTFFLLAFVSLTAWWASGGNPVSMKGKGNLLLFFIIGLLGVALLAMAGAVTALGDTLFPARTLAQGLTQDADINASFLVRLRIIHPILSIIVGTYTLGLGRYLRRKTVTAANRQFSLILGGLILTQMLAGLINVLLLAPVWMQIVHLLLADSLWIAFILLFASTLSETADSKRKMWGSFVFYRKENTQ